MLFAGGTAWHHGPRNTGRTASAAPERAPGGDMEAVTHFAELREHAGEQRSVAPALIDSLRALLGERLSTGAQVRAHHGTDISSYPVTPPDVVVFPHSTAEVVAIVRACA